MDIGKFATAFEQHLHDRRGPLTDKEALAKQMLTCHDRDAQPPTYRQEDTHITVHAGHYRRAMWLLSELRLSHLANEPLPGYDY